MKQNMTQQMSKEERDRERLANLSRRRFLKGVSACIALPAFESLLKGGATATAAQSAGQVAVTSTGAPLRTAFVYFPNGAIPANFWPTGEGKDYVLNKTMEPMADLREKMQVYGGLDQENATAGPDGAGDHARASGTFLTSVRVKKTAGADIHAGVSIDQVMANSVGHMTRFPSLEFSCDAVRRSGNCDSGYSCAYQYNLSWQSPTAPVPPEPNPRFLFERLFGTGDHGQRQLAVKMRQTQQKSILDFVMDDARSVDAQMGSRDKQKLDEYLTSIREIEKRIQDSERFGESPDPDVATPSGIPTAFADYIQLMFDMLVLSFQTDSTRVATFLLANEGSNRPFPEIGIPEGHHDCTHHQNNPEKIAKVCQVDLFYAQQFGKFLTKMDSIKDTDGNSLLHNSMIIYGSGNSDGNRHTHVNLPLIMAGSGGGALQAGRYAKFNGTPMANLFLTMADRMGVPKLERFGDSTGRLTDI
jgi:hypothetical protein